MWCCFFSFWQGIDVDVQTNTQKLYSNACLLFPTMQKDPAESNQMFNVLLAGLHC